MSKNEDTRKIPENCLHGNKFLYLIAPPDNYQTILYQEYAHYTPVLMILLLGGGWHIFQDLFIKHGIYGVLIFNFLPPFLRKSGILGSILDMVR